MLEKIGHYAIESAATIHDEEALTALQLAGRTAAKINEAVDAFNKLEVDTENHLDDQDEMIDKMVNVGMPKAVDEAVHDHISDGTFDAAIDRYAGDLSERVDNLLGSMVEGSTTGDAELIDLRTDHTGRAHANAGNAVRSHVQKLYKTVAYNDIGLTLVPLYWEAGAISPTTGAEVESATRVRCDAYIPVPAAEINIGIVAGYNIHIDEYTFADGAFNFVKAVHSYKGVNIVGTLKHIFDAATTHFRVIIGADDGSNVTLSAGENVAITYDHPKMTELFEKVNKAAGLCARSVVTHNKPDAVNVTGTSKCAVTRRWLFEEVIPAYSHIRNVQIACYDHSGDGVIEVWGRYGETLRRLKAIPISTNYERDYITVPINHYATVDCMIGFYTPKQSLWCAKDQAGHKIYTFEDTASEKLEMSNALLFEDWVMCGNIEYDSYDLSNGATVLSVGHGMEFEEIQDAIDAIKDESTYCIQVYPRATPYKRFSMVQSPMYTQPRNVSIIGMDKKHVIVRDDTGDYQTPPCEALFNGLIKDMTFVATHDAQTADAEKGSYAVHIDFRTYENMGADMTFENCDFVSYQAPAVGMGTHTKTSVTFKDCSFVSYADPAYMPFEGYKNLANYGAFFAHCAIAAGTTEQNLTVDNCRIYAEKADRAMWLGDACTSGSSPMTVKAYHNILWCDAAGAVKLVNAGGNIHLHESNFGNNATELNN